MSKAKNITVSLEEATFTNNGLKKCLSTKK